MASKRSITQSDCQSCGACCCNPDENRREGYGFYVEVGKGEPLLKKPDLLRRYAVVDDHGVPHIRLDAAGRCSALKGPLGKRVKCRIYHVRPRGCRRVQAGGADCLKARRERLGALPSEAGRANNPAAIPIKPADPFLRGLPPLLQHQHMSAAPEPTTCPRCGHAFRSARNGGVQLSACPHCAGIWLSNEAGQALMKKALGKARRVVRNAPATRSPAKVDTSPSGLRCPVCAGTMGAMSLPGSGIVVDTCYAHGTFYDKGELDGVLQHRKRKRDLEKQAVSEARYAAQEDVEDDYEVPSQGVGAFLLAIPLGDILEVVVDVAGAVLED